MQDFLLKKNRNLYISKIDFQFNLGLLHPLTGTEPTCSISKRAVNWAMRDWMCTEHQKHWQSTPGHRHTKKLPF